MPMITYQCEDISFDFKHKAVNNRWIRSVCSQESRRLGDVAFVFCSDSYILDINERYLGHDYYTDVITFDYCEGDIVSGDLIISIDSVRDNAAHFGTSFDNELDRVMVHGILHLIGYDDHSDEDIKQMRSKEDFYIKAKGEFTV